LDLIDETAGLAGTLLAFAKKHRDVPMVGRTHMQPGMPSSVGLWASSFTEALLDDIVLLEAAYALNDRCPLGAAAGYGVPLPLDRALTARLLGFSRPVHNTSHAINSRGKLESVILQACSQVMTTLSRLAQDFMLYTLPEFRYFSLPDALTTGSSIMPNKRNPDSMELTRSRAVTVAAHAECAAAIVRSSPTGYNRDLHDTKEPFLEGVAMTRQTIRVMQRCIEGVRVHEDRLLAGFTPDVFATDRALELVAGGMPFRDAYHHVKAHLHELENLNPRAAIAAKTHAGTTGGLDFAAYARQVAAVAKTTGGRRKSLRRVRKNLLGI
jgi:argininosuccinate lyase